MGYFQKEVHPLYNVCADGEAIAREYFGKN